MASHCLDVHPDNLQLKNQKQEIIPDLPNTMKNTEKYKASKKSFSFNLEALNKANTW